MSWEVLPLCPAVLPLTAALLQPEPNRLLLLYHPCAPSAPPGSLQGCSVLTLTDMLWMSRQKEMRWWNASWGSRVE